MTHEEFDRCWAVANPATVQLAANAACELMEYQFEATLWEQLAPLYPEVNA